MRSSEPRVDDKYGIPLHHPSSTRPYDPIIYSTLRGAAPPFSPVSGPALQQPSTFAPPLRGDALHGDDGHGDWDLGQESAESLDVRAPRDVYDEPNKLARPDERVGAYNHRTPSPASARLSHAMPQDVVTSMALSLGAPARPSRADGSAKRPATMRSEVSCNLCQVHADFADQSVLHVVHAFRSVLRPQAARFSYLRPWQEQSPSASPLKVMGVCAICSSLATKCRSH